MTLYAVATLTGGPALTLTASREQAEEWVRQGIAFEPIFEVATIASEGGETPSE